MALQALTTSVAFWYGLETFKLRQQVTDTVEVSLGCLMGQQQSLTAAATSWHYSPRGCPGGQTIAHVSRDALVEHTQLACVHSALGLVGQQGDNIGCSSVVQQLGLW